jgi:hypothetical protein
MSTRVTGTQPPVILITAKATLAAGAACLCLTVTEEAGNLWRYNLSETRNSRLEQLGADTSPAAQAYRDRTFTRHTELHDQRTTIQAQLDDLAAAVPDQDPALLDELPYLTSQLEDAPADLVEALINALDIQILYRPEQDQATIWATPTDTTPATITVLLHDPRVTASQTTTQPGTPDPISELAQGPIWPKLAMIMVYVRNVST